MNPENAVASGPLYFNFHNLVTVEVIAEAPKDRAFFAAEYQYHQGDGASRDVPGISLHFRRSSLWARPPQGYTFHQHKQLARWWYRMQVDHEHIEIDVIGNRLAVPMVHHMLLHPSLRYLCARQGVLLLHAGAVSHLGRSLIFTGYGGAGKTTTTSLMLAGGGEDWSPHGDDYIFLSPGPLSLAYMTRSHLYSDLLRWVPEVSERLNGAERPRLEIFSRIRRWSQDRLKWAVRLPSERLWPGRELATSAKPAAVILLERNSNVQRPTLHPLAVDERLVSGLVRMNFYEARHFLNLIQKSRSVPGFSSWLEEWQSREKALLQEQLHEVPVYQLDLPSEVRSPASFRSEMVEELTSLVELSQ